mmetsp:Transcript_62931/g.153221  ORF Transcript_62931/g.153221 Transcript_62931/m.153221 type:complete len:256 (-) Transcript_62931:1645-2412(-)
MSNHTSSTESGTMSRRGTTSMIGLSSVYGLHNVGKLLGLEGVLNKKSQSGSGSNSKSHRMLKKEFVEEMRYLSKLRHPCITTVMGAVIDEKNDPLMIMGTSMHRFLLGFDLFLKTFWISHQIVFVLKKKSLCTMVLCTIFCTTRRFIWTRGCSFPSYEIFHKGVASSMLRISSTVISRQLMFLSTTSSEPSWLILACRKKRTWEGQELHFGWPQNSCVKKRRTRRNPTSTHLVWSCMKCTQGKTRTKVMEMLWIY